MKAAKVALVFVIWALLGLSYWWISRTNCCATKGKPNTEVTAINTEDQDTSLRVAEGMNTLVFRKSSSELTSSSAASLAADIKKQLASGQNITITGIAFEDEENPRELALDRAESINRLVNDSTANIKIRAEIINDPFTDNGVFIIIESKEQAETVGLEVIGDLRILEEDNTTYFYIDRDLNKVKVPVKLKERFRKIANRLDGNFHKVILNAYCDDRSKGASWNYQAREHLIRYGVIPSRISSFNFKQGNRESEIMEIKILD